ncbi:MAG: hypothetical protein HY908_14160 [Myxococcales bacterium]|nr:hypothetical protein [Myxococcales bacterium]
MREGHREVGPFSPDAEAKARQIGGRARDDRVAVARAHGDIGLERLAAAEMMDELGLHDPSRMGLLLVLERGAKRRDRDVADRHLAQDFPRATLRVVLHAERIGAEGEPCETARIEAKTGPRGVEVEKVVVGPGRVGDDPFAGRQSALDLRKPRGRRERAPREAPAEGVVALELQRPAGKGAVVAWHGLVGLDLPAPEAGQLGRLLGEPRRGASAARKHDGRETPLVIDRHLARGAGVQTGLVPHGGVLVEGDCVADAMSPEGAAPDAFAGQLVPPAVDPRLGAS